jgi:hypothetical protein
LLLSDKFFYVGREMVEKLDSKVADNMYERELANYIEESSP